MITIRRILTKVFLLFFLEFAYLLRRNLCISQYIGNMYCQSHYMSLSSSHLKSSLHYLLSFSIWHSRRLNSKVEQLKALLNSRDLTNDGFITDIHRVRLSLQQCYYLLHWLYKSLSTNTKYGFKALHKYVPLLYPIPIQSFLQFQNENGNE